jgi:hypothetical protein
MFVVTGSQGWLPQPKQQIMEINFHLRNLDAADTSFVQRVPGQETKVVRDEVALENSRALTTALHNTPESRQDVVRRATELVGNAAYPPPETIRMISHLLAIQMETESEQP